MMRQRSSAHARRLPFHRLHLRALLLLWLPALLLSEPRDPPGGEGQAGERRPFNSYLPQLLAVAGVTATGNDSVDAALQAAAASHFQVTAAHILSLNSFFARLRFGASMLPVTPPPLQSLPGCASWIFNCWHGGRGGLRRRSRHTQA